MFNNSGYNKRPYNLDFKGSAIGGAIRYVAFPKRVGFGKKMMHVGIDTFRANIFPNQQKPLPPPVIVYPPIKFGNPIGLLLAFTYSDGGHVPEPPKPIPVVTGNPIGLLLSLTYELEHPGQLPPPPPPPDYTGQAIGILLVWTYNNQEPGLLPGQQGNYFTTENGYSIICENGDYLEY